MLTTYDIDILQVCRAKWRALKDKKMLTPVPDSYLNAIKHTIFQMYSWYQEKEKLMNEVQIRDRWDTNHKAIPYTDVGLTDGTAANQLINGWMVVHKYWDRYYLEEPELYPVGVNFEFSYYNQNIHYRPHVDIVLVDKHSNFVYRSIGERISQWHFMNQLAKKVETLALVEALGKAPIRMEHIGIHGKNLDHSSFNVTLEYLQRSKTAVDYLSYGMKQEVFYTSESSHCKNCPFNKMCLY